MSAIFFVSISLFRHTEAGRWIPDLYSVIFAAVDQTFELQLQIFSQGQSKAHPRPSPIDFIDYPEGKREFYTLCPKCNGNAMKEFDFPKNCLILKRILSETRWNPVPRVAVISSLGLTDLRIPDDGKVASIAQMAWNGREWLRTRAIQNGC
jgi:hypothetical protein